MSHHNKHGYDKVRSMTNNMESNEFCADSFLDF